MRFEGGFQGRCNKLVDGCYSFWQAGLLPLLHRALSKEGRLLLLVFPNLIGCFSSVLPYCKDFHKLQFAYESCLGQSFIVIRVHSLFQPLFFPTEQESLS